MYTPQPQRTARIVLLVQALAALPVAAEEAPVTTGPRGEGAAAPTEGAAALPEDAAALPERAAAQPDGADYESALAQARAAASPLEIEAAIRALAAVLSRFPQDVEGPLQLGWLEFRAGRYTDAVAHYGQALARSVPGGDAELGLAWSLLKLGRCAEAAPHFRSVIASRPQSNAAAGLQQCAPASGPAAAPAARALWLQPQLMQSLYLYEQNPALSRALATTARLDVLWRGRYYGAATYRYSYFGAAPSSSRAFSQHDLFLAAGLTTRPAGVTLHYAFLADTSGSTTSGPSHHLGLGARYTRYVDVVLNNAVSLYPDGPLWRGELAVRIPIPRGFILRPAGALQWAAARLWETGSLTALYEHRRFSLWLGGKVGEELRPAYFDVAYVYNIQARIRYGLWAGAAVRPGAGFTISLGYAHDRMLTVDSTWTATAATPSLPMQMRDMQMSGPNALGTASAAATEFLFHSVVLGMAKEL